RGCPARRPTAAGVARAGAAATAIECAGAGAAAPTVEATATAAAVEASAAAAISGAAAIAYATAAAIHGTGSGAITAARAISRRNVALELVATAIDILPALLGAPSELVARCCILAVALAKPVLAAFVAVLLSPAMLRVVLPVLVVGDVGLVE